MRVYNGDSDVFILRDAIRMKFWPCLFGGSVDDWEADMFTLPTRLGGMGMRDPVRSASNSFHTSRQGCEKIISHMKEGDPFMIGEHEEALVKAKKHGRQVETDIHESLLDNLLSKCDQQKARALKRASHGTKVSVCYSEVSAAEGCLLSGVLL